MKIVIVINRSLPLGVIANASAVLAMSIGRKYPEIVGADALDKDGRVHLGITTKNIPILGLDAAALKTLREKLYELPPGEIDVVDFTVTALRGRDYAAYQKALSSLRSSELEYVGAALIGEEKKVNRWTGSIPLLK